LHKLVSHVLLVPVFRLNSALCILAPGPTAGAK